MGLATETSRSAAGELYWERTVMTLVQWRNEYRVGAESIDDEHKVLIERINRLDDQLMAEDGPLAASTFFEQLAETIAAHFGREDRFMRERGYDQLPPRKEDYERFLDEIYNLIEELDSHEKASREVLAARLYG
jgi:hemerythrin